MILAAFAAPLTEVAFKFGPAEYFSLMILGLIGAVVLASGSLLKAIAMIILGLLFGTLAFQADARAQGPGNSHREQDRWKRKHHVDAAHHHGIETTSYKAGHHAQGAAYQQRHAHGRHAQK